MNITTMRILADNIKGCDELINWLSDPLTQEELCLKPVMGNKGSIIFQGDKCEIEYFEPDTLQLFIHNNCIFAVSGVEFDDMFELQCIPNGTALTDYYVTLPAYVRDELIATIKGEW